MDFTEGDQLAEHREQARAWVRENVRQEWVDDEHRTGTHHNRELHERLAADGILAAGWPAEYGGSDVDEGYAQAVLQEIANFGLRMDGWVTTWMVTHTILEVADEATKQRFVPAALRGEVVIVLGYTEPGSGSDVAAAKSRAVRDGDEWVINGSKMFTSTAHVGTHVFFLARTNTGVPKHAGLSLFMIPLDAPGVEVKPIHTLGGQRTNATYYQDVRIDDSLRVGEVDAGWNVMKVALVFERGVGGGPAGSTLAEEFADWAREVERSPGERLLDCADVRETLARVAIRDEISRLFGLRTAWVSATGGMPAVEGAMAKLYSSERSQRSHVELLDLLGPDGVVSESDPSAPHGGAVEHAFRNGVVATIYGGSSEIMREIVSERRLGLPRTKPPRVVAKS